MTDDKSLPKDERKKQQIVHAAHMTTKAKLIKLADKLYNLTGTLPLGVQTPSNLNISHFVMQTCLPARRKDGLSSESRDTLCVASERCPFTANTALTQKKNTVIQVWGKFCVDALRGTNIGLEKALDGVFASSFVCDGISHPVLPDGDLNTLLEEYYKDMAKTG